MDLTMDVCDDPILKNNTTPWNQIQARRKKTNNILVCTLSSFWVTLVLKTLVKYR